MSTYRVVEKSNKNAVHCYTWSIERCKYWVNTIGVKHFPEKEFIFQKLGELAEWVECN